MRKDRFTDEALAQAKALAELKYSENPEDQLAFSEAYDFARCQRPDGSFYGIADGKQCKRGKKAAPASPQQRAAKRATAIGERAGTVEDKLFGGSTRNPAKLSAMLDKLEKRAKAAKDVAEGRQSPSARLRKALSAATREISRLEDKLMRPNSPNPGTIQDRIDRLESKAARIKKILDRGASSRKGK
jgi:hypothetical protein